MDVNEGASTSKELHNMNLVREDDVLPGCSSFDDFIQTSYPLVMNGIKCSNSLPADKQYSFYSTFPEFKTAMKKQQTEIQNMMQRILTYCGGKRSIAVQCPEDKFDLIIDTNDILMERISNNLSVMDRAGRHHVVLYDEFSNGGTEPRIISESWNRNHLNSSKHFDNTSNRIEKESTKTVVKPQSYFKDKVDNGNETWVPIIKEKPNALKPLSILITSDEKCNECYTHPYDYELSLLKTSSDRLKPITNVQFPKPLNKTPLVFIKDEAEVDKLIADLLKQKEIAVDLEHHSFRSFMGITCLLQISTRKIDYIVDALAVRHVLYKLNEVFTKPSILKIFHSADSDIEWLQRDFGVYVVNMFDTYQAAKILSYAKLGLSFLLRKFCNVVSEKRFQMFDWRIRPLPEKAKLYARTDTHYLIYIYETMSNELIAQGAFSNLAYLSLAFERSTETCRRIYHKPLLTEDSYMKMYRKSKLQFDSRQLYALKEIFNWRDSVAREEDESTGYILTNHMMMQICQTLPREVQGILACCNPIPPAVRQHLTTLHEIVLKAKEQPLVMPIVDESAKPSSQFSASRDFDLEAKISTYIHDNSGLEFRDDYPTLLGSLDEAQDCQEIQLKIEEEMLLKPVKLPIIVNSQEEFINLEGNNSAEDVANKMDEITRILEKVRFVTPYERYKKVLPYSRQLEEEERENQRIEEEKNQQRLLRAQYDIEPDSNGIDDQTVPENNEEKEKENILKRPADAINADKPLSSNNPGKKRRMMQKFELCETNDINSAADSLITVNLKREPEDNDVGSTNEGSIGVCGGEVSVVKPSIKSARTKDHRKPEEVTPYDYRKVDFSKFQSTSSLSNKSAAQSKGKMKRKKKFQSKHHGNRKGGRKN